MENFTKYQPLTKLKRLESMRQADPAYIAARNKFIPLAEALANQEAGSSDKGMGEEARAAWSRKWNAVFSYEMQKMVDESGIRSGKKGVK